MSLSAAGKVTYLCQLLQATMIDLFEEAAYTWPVDDKVL